MQFGVPSASVAGYARWWQLENYLRLLVYIELCSQHAGQWKSYVAKTAHDRQKKEQGRDYMATSDADELMAHLDVFDLLALVEKDWEVFEPSLFGPKHVWLGRVDEIRHLRHRLAHCRQPHRDDLARLEQFMRDIEPGAWRSVNAFVDSKRPHRDLSDPVVEAWVRHNHPDARRLVNHADQSYHAKCLLGYTVRPWASAPGGTPISGQAGIFWNASFTLGKQQLWPDDLWEVVLDSDIAERLVILSANTPGQFRFTFAAVDDPAVIADAIGECFDLLLTHCSYDGDIMWSQLERWITRGEGISPRLQIATEFSADSPFPNGLPYFGV